MLGVLSACVLSFEIDNRSKARLRAKELLIEEAVSATG